jgi:hypothetical protein
MPHGYRVTAISPLNGERCGIFGCCLTKDAPTKAWDALHGLLNAPEKELGKVTFLFTVRGLKAFFDVLPVVEKAYQGIQYEVMEFTGGQVMYNDGLQVAIQP